jgi:hypothetical protein
MTNSTIIFELRNIGKHLHKARCKGENRINKIKVGLGKEIAGF